MTRLSSICVESLTLYLMNLLYHYPDALFIFIPDCYLDAVFLTLLRKPLGRLNKSQYLASLWTN